MTQIAVSVNGVSIRLTRERWEHIIYSHREINSEGKTSILKVISNPDFVAFGVFGELLAVRKKAGSRKWIVVVYKEINSKDGFIITAYITSNLAWLLKKEIIWEKP